MRKHNTIRGFALTLTMALMLAGCQTTTTPPETPPAVTEATPEETAEASTEDKTPEATTEEPTSKITEAPTSEEETSTDEETTEEKTSEEETSTEEKTEEGTTESETEEQTTPEETTPTPTTPEPATPTPTTPAPTEPEPTTKAPEPTKAPVTVVSVSGSVKGTHYIGDTLSAGDFVITVTMSDGTTQTNPAGFAVSPLTLSAATNTLTCAYGGVSSTFTVTATERPAQPTQPVNPPVNGSYDNRSVTYNGNALVDEAMKYYGVTYVYGGNSLQSGTDCSGFTKLLYAQFGLNLPRTAAEQWNMPGDFIDISQAKPGDLVVADPSEYIDSHFTGHAGIYMGDGWVINEYPGQPGSCTITYLWGWQIKRIGNNIAQNVTTEHYVSKIVKERLNNGTLGVGYFTDAADGLYIGVSTPFDYQQVKLCDNNGHLANGFSEADVKSIIYLYYIRYDKDAGKTMSEVIAGYHIEDQYDHTHPKYAELVERDYASARNELTSDKQLYLKYQAILHLKEWAWYKD